jgi:superfamily I DNA and/or RNA helicase
MQYPPFGFCRPDSSQKSEEMRQSIMAYLSRGNYHDVIDTQYRSHRDIAECIAQFYPYEVHNGKQSSEFFPFLDGLRFNSFCESPSTRVRVANTGTYSDRKEDRKEDSNEEEAESINCLLEKMGRVLDTREGEETKKVLILTPYSNQLRLLRRKICVTHRRMTVEVATFDSIQGDEADVVILSLVRTHSLGFMKDAPYRLIVSCTRAKGYLFVFGRVEVFYQDRYWKRFLEMCMTKKALYDSYHYSKLESWWRY